MTLPRSWDEAVFWIFALSPSDWANARLGGITVLVVVVIISIVVAAVVAVRR